jgi:hypothetical protein
MISKEALQVMFDGKREEKRYLSEKSFLLFALYYFNNYFTYRLAPFHYDMEQDLRDLMSGKIRECAWIMFRESAKTTLAKLFILWLIVNKKKLYINVDSFDRENSERILFDIAFELTNNKLLQSDYGILFSRTRGIDEIKQNRINNFVTENGIRVEAHSTQESVRGRIHLTQRPDFILLDDFETNKTKDSEAYTKQIREHISEAMSGMSPDGIILYLGNYITEFGNVQFLFNREKTDKGLRVRNVPVMVDDTPTWEAKYALTDDEAKKNNKVSIEDKKRQLGSYVFSYEMMNQPVDEMTAEFKRAMFHYRTEDDLKDKRLNRYLTIDLAFSQKDSADYIGFVDNRVDPRNCWNLIAWRQKLDPKEFIDALFTLHANNNYAQIGIEDMQYTLVIKPFIDEEMRKRNKFLPIVLLKHGGVQKETRIRGLLPRYGNGAIYHLLGRCDDLETELIRFPHATNDDVSDSCQYQLQLAQPPNADEIDMMWRKSQSQNKVKNNAL